MIKIIVLFAGILKLVNCFADWGYPEKDDVIIATPENLENILK